MKKLKARISLQTNQLKVLQVMKAHHRKQRAKHSVVVAAVVDVDVVAQVATKVRLTMIILKELSAKMAKSSIRAQSLMKTVK